MRAGTLRHLITIQKPVTTGTGDRGQPVKTWCKLYTVHASVTTLTGKEAEIQHEIVASASHIIKTRYLAGVDETCQVLFGCKTFGIGNVAVGDRAQDNRKLGLTLLVMELKT